MIEQPRKSKLVERDRKENREKRLPGGIPVPVASCDHALTVIWLWGLIHFPLCLCLWKSGVCPFTMTRVLMNKAVIRKIKMPWEKTPISFTSLIT